MGTRRIRIGTNRDTKDRARSRSSKMLETAHSTRKPRTRIVDSKCRELRRDRSRPKPAHSKCLGCS
eukprot:2464502-Rhodomonas_salina.1